MRLKPALACLAALGAGLALSGFKDDPFDPVLGPRNPRPGAELYLKDRTDISAEDKKALLDYRAVPPEILAKLAEAPAREVRALVGSNPSADEALLTKLSQDKEMGVQQSVAGNHNTPKALLQKLYDQGEPQGSLRYSVEHNPNWKKP